MVSDGPERMAEGIWSLTGERVIANGSTVEDQSVCSKSRVTYALIVNVVWKFLLNMINTKGSSPC